VLDVSLPHLNGLDLQKRIARTSMPIVFITGYGDVPTTVEAMKGGAVEFLTKPFDADVLHGAISDAIERSRTALAREAETQALRDDHALLTPREREIMALVTSGLLNKQIANKLGISEITVKAHRGRVMRKMHVGSFADLVKAAAALEVVNDELLALVVLVTAGCSALAYLQRVSLLVTATRAPYSHIIVACCRRLIPRYRNTIV
jgi:FixJ family two-component response regulator